MRRISLSLFCFLAVISLAAQNARMDAFIRDLMSRMSVEEKIGQLNLSTAGGFITGAAVNENVRQKLLAGEIGGIFNSFSLANIRALQEVAVKQSPNKIPLIFGMDVIHGYKTIFPIPLALSCTWDLELVEESARIAAREATANGVAWTFSPMVDLSRDPRWGRVAEGNGEDPWLSARIARAMVRGYQGSDLTLPNTMMACVKHFALYGAAEAGRDYNTVDMSRITMYNDYLPPYRAAIDAGAGSVMTSFNVVDAVPATGNRWLLTDLLRRQWGFDGFVVTDYTAINEMVDHGLGDLQAVSALALKAGTDMDMVGEGFLTTLKRSLDEGRVSMQDIDQACRRVLEAKYKLGLFDDPFRYIDEQRPAAEVLTEQHRQVARAIAARSFVLLKNEGQTLPLKRSGVIAVVGQLAGSPRDALGTWSMGGEPEQTVSVLQGIRNTAGQGVEVLYAEGSPLATDKFMLQNVVPFGPPPPDQDWEKVAVDMRREALEVAAKADVIVAVLGEAMGWSGEASSMTDISLQPVQQELLKALLATGKPVVLVLVNGRPMTLGWEAANVPAILEAWAGGTEMGNAVADVLFGDYNPSGKLTSTFPRKVGQIPLYYNHKNTGRPLEATDKFTTKYLDSPNDPLFPFGYGLSYTTFEYGTPRVNKEQLTGEEKLTVTVAVTNTGSYAGEEVVQLYIQDPVASISRPVKELKNFSKVMLLPGETKEVALEVTTDDLSFYNSELTYDWEPGDFILHVGGNSRDVQSVTVNWTK